MSRLVLKKREISERGKGMHMKRTGHFKLRRVNKPGLFDVETKVERTHSIKKHDAERRELLRLID